MHVELSIDLPASPERVWRVAQNPELRPRWDQRVARYDVQGPPKPGTPVVMTLRMGFLRPRAMGTFMRWEPPRQSVLKVDSESPLVASGAGSWTFTPIPGGTRYTTRFTLDESQLHPLVWRWLYRKAVEWDTRRSLKRLRRLIQELTQQ